MRAWPVACGEPPIANLPWHQIEHVSDNARVDDEALFPAPLNSVRRPHGSKRGYPGRSRPVLVRLVRPRGTIMIAANLAWVDGDVVCVEWERHGVSRRTWLRRSDVALWIPLA